jgi:RNA polymerase sigma-70 factor (ECF subfamily)
MPIDVEHAYRRHGPMVRRQCQRLLGDPEAARDAMHDTFVRLVRRKDDLDDHALGGLLYRIATNVCLNRIRTRHRRPEDPHDELIARIAAADDPAERGLARSLLDRLFAREPESTRTIAVLHLLDGMTLEEVAAEVGLSVSGVRFRLRGLRAQLSDLEVA